MVSGNRMQTTVSSKHQLNSSASLFPQQPSVISSPLKSSSSSVASFSSSSSASSLSPYVSDSSNPRQSNYALQPQFIGSQPPGVTSTIQYPGHGTKTLQQNPGHGTDMLQQPGSGACSAQPFIYSPTTSQQLGSSPLQHAQHQQPSQLMQQQSTATTQPPQQQQQTRTNIDLSQLFSSAMQHQQHIQQQRQLMRSLSQGIATTPAAMATHQAPSSMHQYSHPQVAAPAAYFSQSPPTNQKILLPMSQQSPPTAPYSVPLSQQAYYYGQSPPGLYHPFGSPMFSSTTMQGGSSATAQDIKQSHLAPSQPGRSPAGSSRARGIFMTKMKEQL